MSVMRPPLPPPAPPVGTFTHDKCPRRSEHTACPTSILTWGTWARRKAKTHHQVRCEGCNLFAIWVPNGSAAASPKGEAPSTKAPDSES